MILLTGGTGFIGSHVCCELIEKGYKVVIMDDLSNSKESVIDRIEEITGVRPSFVYGDVCNKELLEEVFRLYDIEGVIHFAGKKAVGESCVIPLSYYRNNLDATITLMEVMKQFNVTRLVFSSSATVYRSSNPVPYVEGYEIGSTNPYGWTKVMSEQIMEDACNADKDLSVVALRYFNPIGAHKSGLIGEAPNGIPNNLMPYIVKVAKGLYPKLSIFGNDYDTVDGTGVRDYIHVVDLAKAHVKAIEFAMDHVGFEPINLGSGNGISVLELVRAFESSTGVKIPYEIAPRRSGDIATCYANVDKAKKLLNWQTEKTVEEMCQDSWNFEKNWKED